MKVLLLDANNLAMRAIFAMQRSRLTSDEGVSTGPLLVFVNALSRHVREEQPDAVAICWDSGPSTYRLGLYPQYKGGRAKMDPDAAEEKHGTFGLIKEFLSLAGLYNVTRQGYEADDLIAWYVARKASEDEVVILSSDKDFLQLLQPGVTQVRFASQGAPVDRWDHERVLAEFGCTPRQIPLAMALAGDTVDNVPGMKGFGMKTAVKHLAKADWDLAKIEHPVVQENFAQVLVNYQLVDLLLEMPLNLPGIPRFSPTAPGQVLYKPLLSFLDQYQLKSVLTKVYANTLWESEKVIHG